MRSRRALLLLLAGLAGAAYVWRLSDTPIYLHDAEVLFALHARALAATLHDANGRLLPLYIQMPQIGGDTWFHPMLPYVTAIFLKVLPLSEWSLRLPAVFVGVADLLLVGAICSRLMNDVRYGLLAAGLLALTPAHFIHSRLAMDYIYPLPFVLGWLWCLLRFDEDGRARWVALGTFTLGVGFFSYIGGAMLVPLYFLITCALVIARDRQLNRPFWIGVAGFCLPLTLLLLWLPAHPNMFDETVGRYGVSTGNRLHALRALVTYAQIQEYIARYWNLSSPVYLFFVGSSNWVDSTRRAGAFLLPTAVFLTAGVVDFIVEPGSRIRRVILAGVLTAPLGAVFVGEPWAIQRELELLPFVVIIAVFGARRLLRSGRPAMRAIAIAALVATPLQFADFYRDYFTDYRLNSLGWFGSNLRGTVTEVLRLRASQPPEAIYVSRVIPYALENWKLYLAVNHREDWWPRTRTFDATFDLASVPRGSVIVEPMAQGRPVDPLANAPELRQIGLVTVAEGGTSFAILERR